MVRDVKGFVLPRTRKGAAYRVDRTLPEIAATWQRYDCRATVRQKKVPDEESVRYKTYSANGEQINWDGHASPDTLPPIRALHPTEAQVLAVLWHRVYANGMVDTKLTNEELASAIGRSKRTVARALKRLTQLGFIGICHVKFGRGKATATWRMIRVHAAGFLVRWETWESPTWFLTDLRPDSQRGPVKERMSYNLRVGYSGRLPRGWGIKERGMAYDRATNEMVMTDPKIDPNLGPLFTALRRGWIPEQWYDDHQRLLDDHDYGEPYAVQVLGKRKMQKDLNDPQLVR